MISAFGWMDDVGFGQEIGVDDHWPQALRLQVGWFECNQCEV